MMFMEAARTVLRKSSLSDLGFPCPRLRPETRSDGFNLIPFVEDDIAPLSRNRPMISEASNLNTLRRR